MFHVPKDCIETMVLGHMWRWQWWVVWDWVSSRSHSAICEMPYNNVSRRQWHPLFGFTQYLDQHDHLGFYRRRSQGATCFPQNLVGTTSLRAPRRTYSGDATATEAAGPMKARSKSTIDWMVCLAACPCSESRQVVNSWLVECQVLANSVQMEHPLLKMASLSPKAGCQFLGPRRIQTGHAWSSRWGVQAGILDACWYLQPTKVHQ